jgi:segregation and condensation protein A
MNLNVKLEIYEGPLDLLLHLIRKNEVDIYDIPIALITEQYLEYLGVLEAMNVEVAGEFLLMAATLTHIKSRMLVPQVETEEAQETEEDPRMAIVRPLLEHMKLKDAADGLERRDLLNRDVFARDPDLELLGVEPRDENLLEANLFDLIDAFRRLAKRFEKTGGLQIVVDTKTIQQRIVEIMRLLAGTGQAAFIDACRTDRSKADLVLTFLAVLELARVGHLKLFQHHDSREITLFLVEDRPFLGLASLGPDGWDPSTGEGMDQDEEFVPNEDEDDEEEGDDDVDEIDDEDEDDDYDEDEDDEDDEDEDDEDDEIDDEDEDDEDEEA